MTTGYNRNISVSQNVLKFQYSGFIRQSRGEGEDEGGSTGNLPGYTKVSPVKLKFSAIGVLSTLRFLIKKSYEPSFRYHGFFGTTKYHLLAYNNRFYHFL